MSVIKKRIIKQQPTSDSLSAKKQKTETLAYSAYVCIEGFLDNTVFGYTGEKNVDLSAHKDELAEALAYLKESGDDVDLIELIRSIASEGSYTLKDTKTDKTYLLDTDNLLFKVEKLEGDNRFSLNATFIAPKITISFQNETEGYPDIVLDGYIVDYGVYSADCKIIRQTLKAEKERILTMLRGSQTKMLKDKAWSVFAVANGSHDWPVMREGDDAIDEENVVSYILDNILSLLEDYIISDNVNEGFNEELRLDVMVTTQSF